METLSADKDDHKAGDVVYRLPQDAADRIRDFLAMTVLEKRKNFVKGVTLSAQARWKIVSRISNAMRWISQTRDPRISCR